MNLSFTLLSESIAYETPFFTIMDRLYKLPDGSEHHFYIRKEVDTCCVLAMTKDHQFITAKQFRPGPGKILTELPAGRVDDEMNPDKQIAHELLQETGYSGDFIKVGVMPASPYSTRSIHCFYAIHCEKTSEQELDSTEHIEVELLTQEQMRELLENGHSSSCAPGLLAWEKMKKDGHLL